MGHNTDDEPARASTKSCTHVVRCQPIDVCGGGSVMRTPRSTTRSWKCSMEVRYALTATMPSPLVSCGENATTCLRFNSGQVVPGGKDAADAAAVDGVDNRALGSRARRR